MYLIDTNVISELRKGERANFGVRSFFQKINEEAIPVFISVITVGELRRGVELIRHRGDQAQAEQLEQWLEGMVEEYAQHILEFTAEEAQVWGKLRVPHYQDALDKQIAAIALTYDLIVVTRNVKDFSATGVGLLNPFE